MKRSSELKRTPFNREAKPPAGKKARKCKNRACRAPFVSDRPFVEVCSPDCAEVIGKERTAKQKAAKAKKERADDRKKLEAMKPPKWWKAKAKTAMHAYVRAIAEGKPCISCDTILLKLGRPGGDYDAGHFRSVGSAKHLEFDERNIFGQCKYCNDFMKGNQMEYERRLRLLKGDAYVDELKADQAPRHYKIADFQAIEALYKTKLRKLKKDNHEHQN